MRRLLLLLRLAMLQILLRRLAPQACPECGTRYLPRGSWCLFLDDVTSVAWPDHFSLHELVMLGFLTAQQKRVHPGV